MISNVFINRPRLAMAALVVIALAGCVSLRPQANVATQDVVVVVWCPYLFAQNVESMVARRMEDAMGGEAGLMSMKSMSGDGKYMLALSFADGTDLDLALMRVIDRAQRTIPLLPEDVRIVDSRLCTPLERKEIERRILE
jgi:multidrug efflux pump subunit AcrB